MSTRSRKTRARKARRRTTQPVGRARTPQQHVRGVDGGPHATPVIPIRQVPPAKPAPQEPAQRSNPAQPPTDQYGRLVEEVAEYAAAAALYAGTLRLHAPHAWWTGLTNGQATCLLPDDTRLVHTPGHGLTAHRACPAGTLHTTTIRSNPAHAADDIHRFRINTDICDQHTTPPAGPHVIPLHQRPKENPRGH